uniref:Uncharacterized protein n=1 Tax=Anguilla anguilla TaxID=7936 RepID=A0A0E9V2C8_ANGAN
MVNLDLCCRHQFRIRSEGFQSQRMFPIFVFMDLIGGARLN